MGGGRLTRNSIICVNKVIFVISKTHRAKSANLCFRRAILGVFPKIIYWFRNPGARWPRSPLTRGLVSKRLGTRLRHAHVSEIENVIGCGVFCVW